MPMKRLFAALIVALPALTCACSEEEDILPEQRQKIVSFLERTHTPALVPEADVDAGTTQGYYTAAGNTVYRYIEVDDVYDPNRANYREVTRDSKVTITFRFYVFDYANITDSTFPFYSNDAALKSAYEELGLTVDGGVWHFEPRQIDMRHADILKGLYLALLGCREGDHVEAYMTYTMAYGEKYFSTIPKESPIAVFFEVNQVE